jgi:hypothetical protein
MVCSLEVLRGYDILTEFIEEDWVLTFPLNYLPFEHRVHVLPF